VTFDVGETVSKSLPVTVHDDRFRLTIDAGCPEANLAGTVVIDRNALDDGVDAVTIRNAFQPLQHHATPLLKTVPCPVHQKRGMGEGSPLLRTCSL